MAYEETIQPTPGTLRDQLLTLQATVIRMQRQFPPEEADRLERLLSELAQLEVLVNILSLRGALR